MNKYKFKAEVVKVGCVMPQANAPEIIDNSLLKNNKTPIMLFKLITK
jgi:hypothetical protein